MGVLDFFSQEAGQARRRALDERIAGVLDRVGYYAGPELSEFGRGLLQVGGMLNPVQDVGNAMAAGREGRWGDMAVDVATVVAPVAAGKAAKAINPRLADDAAQWLEDALTGLSVNPTRAGLGDAAQRFAADESGNIPIASRNTLTPAEQQAKGVLDLLTSGRADEVTDEMLAAADDRYLFQNYDLPMDEASRMARARDMGFDADAPVYHGTGADFQAFRVNSNAPERGVWFGSEEVAGRFAKHRDNPQIIPSVTRSKNPYIYDAQNPNRPSKLADIFSDMSQDQTGVNFIGGTSESRTISDPRNIRSRFARFDPRLSHLRNLSAGVGGLGAMGLLSMQPDRAQTEQETRQYLGGLL